MVSLYFLQRHCDSTTPPLTIYSTSIFFPATLRHYNSLLMYKGPVMASYIGSTVS